MKPPDFDSGAIPFKDLAETLAEIQSVRAHLTEVIGRDQAGHGTSAFLDRASRHLHNAYRDLERAEMVCEDRIREATRAYLEMGGGDA